VPFQDFMTTVRNSMTVKTAFGEPLERDGTTIIPVSHVSGGGGAGGGKDEKGAEGEGGGFGMCAQPVGVYVVKGGEVRWHPVLDVNHVLSTIGKIAMVYLYVRSRANKARKIARS